MFSSLLSGLRSIRVSLVSGGMIVVSTYIYMYEKLFIKITVRPALLQLINCNKLIPIVALLFLSLIVGSLYTTFLEGVVDYVHRKNIGRKYNQSFLNINNIFLPYSESAEKRLNAELVRFYQQYQENPTKNLNIDENFVKSVFIEVLWMEGKISGTSIEQNYDRIRSEAELRLACGLLLPLFSSAIAYSLFAGTVLMIVSILIGVILLIPMVNYGFYYYKKANSFLAHHIADGKVLSPSMETLKRTSESKPQSNDSKLILLE